MVNPTQTCPRCKQDRGPERFHPGKWGKPGNYCKDCCNEYKAELRYRNGGAKRVRNPITNRLRSLPTTYHSAHLRIGRLKGKARNFTCSSCGARPAIHWAYIGGAPDEMWGTAGSGKPSPFSNMLNRYTPLCGACHRELDLKPECVCPCSCGAREMVTKCG